LITSRQNRRLKDIRRLRRSKGNRSGELLLEGPHLVAAALDAGLELREVFVTARFLERADAGGLLSRLSPTPITEVSPPLLDELADADAPRGLVAIAAARRDDTRRGLRQGGPVLFLDRIQDPGNLGAVARVAEAAGAAGLCLGPGTVDPAHPRALRASAGSLLRLPVLEGADRTAVRRHLDAPLPWVLLSPADGEDLYRTDLPERLVLLLGSEGTGVSAELARSADLRIRVPMAPPVESLNVAVAAGVVLFELVRRRQQAAEPAAVGTHERRPAHTTASDGE
jgi:TrmH family RNA methyltransferase